MFIRSVIKCLRSGTEQHAVVIVPRTQKLLEKIYQVPGVYRALDFLVTDASKVALLEGDNPKARDVPEKLLVAEDDDGARLALYLDAAVLGRLELDDPHDELSDNNLNDFWTVLEGVSHFNYLTWRASSGRAVSLLELELQAEVDKFICAALLAASQRAGRVPRELHHYLFERHQLDPALDAAGRERYRMANRYAGKYCLRLARKFLSRHGPRGLIEEIRCFYRLGQREKIRHIDHGSIAAA